MLERVPNTNPPVTIEGTLDLRRDTMLVDITPGPCRALQASPQAYAFQCSNDVRLWFDRRDPVQRNEYSVTTTTTVTRRRCAEYALDSSGANRCVRYETQTEEQSATRGGRLRPQRAP